MLTQSTESLFTQTHTHSKFADEPVEPEVLIELYDMVKNNATSFNCQPLRIRYICSDQAKQRLIPHLMEGNQEKTRAAPVCAILAMDLDFWQDTPKTFPVMPIKGLFEGNSELIERTAFRNSSIQIGYFIKAAHALGLATGPMSGFNGPGVDQEFFAGTNITSNILCNLGTPTPEGVEKRLYRYSFEEVGEIL